MQTQRESYRSVNGQTRVQKYPDLYANPRGYEPEHDSQLWSRYRICHYLKDFSFQGKVEKNGGITLFANNYHLSRDYAQRYVEVHFDDLTDESVICDEFGAELRRHPAKELSYELISQLQFAKRRRNPVKAMSL